MTYSFIDRVIIRLIPTYIIPIFPERVPNPITNKHIIDAPIIKYRFTPMPGRVNIFERVVKDITVSVERLRVCGIGDY